MNLVCVEILSEKSILNISLVASGEECFLGHSRNSLSSERIPRIPLIALIHLS